MRWEIDITGDATDLRTLGKAMRNGDMKIHERDGTFILTSAQFESLHDANDVRAQAEKLVTSLSGYSRLVLRTCNPIRVKSVVLAQDDGTKAIFVQSKPAAVYARGSLSSMVITRADGTVEYRGLADSVYDWLQVAAQNPSVETALRLRNEGTLSWVELYRIYEVIEGDAGQSHIIDSDWVKGSDIRLFKHTANSVAASGDQARHGKKIGEPPKNPMTLSQAKTLVDNLLKAWIASKRGRST